MMQPNADTSKLKNLYESLDQLKESGEDVVAEIRKEINNIELQYLKEDVFPELMKFLSRKISWLRCSVDMSLQFDGEEQLDYSFCKSGSTVFIRDKYECDFQDDDITKASETSSNHQAIISSISDPTLSLVPIKKAIVRIVDYSDKAIAVYGDTQRYSDDFKKIGGYFNYRLLEGAGWIFPKKCEQEVRALLKEDVNESYTGDFSPITETTSMKCERGQSRTVSLNNIKCTLEGFRSFLSTLKNNHGRCYSPSSVNVYCTSTRSNYMRSKVLKYHHSGYLYNLVDLQILSQLYDDVQADFEAKKTNSCSPQTIRLYIQFIDTYFSDKKLLEFKSNNDKGIVTDSQQNKPQTNLKDKSRINNVTVAGHAKYSLNGGQPQNKRSIVHSVVSLYMKLHPKSTWSEVLKEFPKELQGSYGVVTSVENIQYRIKKGFDDEKRYFLDPSSQFTTIDGVVFAVCHQWGNQFDKFREYVEDKFDWIIEEV